MSRKKKADRLREEIDFLTYVNNNNIRAMEEGPIKKKWTLHDLKEVRPLTPNQTDMFHAWYNGSHLIAHGSAGTGKTFLALYLAFQEVLDRRYEPNHIIIVRSNVATRDVGHLPGTLDEKMSEYERPYRDICADLFERRTTYDDMKNAGLVSFMPTSFVRGLTWNKAVVIVEEAQNLNFEHEINSIMTRVGYDTRVIVTGDFVQSDLPHNGKDKSGIKQLLHVAKDVRGFTEIKFTQHDIVRSEFVKSWIIATEQVLALA